MPSKKDFLRMCEDATAFCDQYRSTNIDPVHRRADLAYQSILENEQDYTDRQRSALFIPKTRDHVRKWTTNIVNAFYLSDDLVSVSYPIDMDKEKFSNELVNGRLEKDTEFYKFLCFAANAHCKYGNAVGKTGWEYSEEVSTQFDELGNEYKVIAPEKDRPFFEVIPFENIQYDFRVISTDPVQDSPFWRHWIPMYFGDVDAKFASGEWKKPRDKGWERVRIPTNTDTVRKTRQGKMQDPQAQSYGDGSDTVPGRSYRQTWAVENYFRIDGTDWTFISIGDEVIVTEITRVVDKFAHGRRPYALSQFDPEAFRSYSQGIPEMFRHLQAEVNAIRNQRRDNVSLVLNAGHYVRRGAGIHMPSLVNSRPGRVILGDTIRPEDIRREEVIDVTASAYREEEIASRDIDEISGQSQERMGVTGSDRQTATEAAIKASSAGEIEGYVIKGFVESFVRPLLEMYYDNVVAYETDPGRFVEAAINTGLPPDPSLLVRGELIINAGMGTTNKELRAMKLERIIDRCIQLAAVDPSFALAAKKAMMKWLPLAGEKNVDAFFPPNQPSAAPQVPGGPPALPAGAPPPPTMQEVPPGFTSQGNLKPGLGGMARGMLQ